MSALNRNKEWRFVNVALLSFLFSAGVMSLRGQELPAVVESMLRCQAKEGFDESGYVADANYWDGRLLAGGSELLVERSRVQFYPESEIEMLVRMYRLPSRGTVEVRQTLSVWMVILRGSRGRDQWGGLIDGSLADDVGRGVLAALMSQMTKAPNTGKYDIYVSLGPAVLPMWKRSFRNFWSVLVRDGVFYAWTLKYPDDQLSPVARGYYPIANRRWLRRASRERER